MGDAAAIADVKKRFEKPFTQQEPIDEATIGRIADILRSGRLHRYNTVGSELAEASLLEQEYADYQQAKYCIACTSGGYALHVALRSSGLKPGDRVLANAHTLAPVPGAIHNAGGVPIFVEIDENWHIDIDDLEDKARQTGARFLMLSHMRGHIADMDRISRICDELNITLIEDCAHTMGAKWKGQRSGNFGKVGCFSTQTYKHINSGEGGLITTDDDEIAARAIIHSGSYMFYERHGRTPPKEVFDRIKLQVPNYSGRMDNMRAALIRGQIQNVDRQIERWNERYRVLEQGLVSSPQLFLPRRGAPEAFVGSSIQFQFRDRQPAEMEMLVEQTAARGVELKWFGAPEPKAFTSRYDSWNYLENIPVMPRTDEILSATFDLRIPLTFDLDDCALIAEIIVDEVAAIAA